MDIGFWGAWVLLGVTSIFDLRYKRIPLLLIISGTVLGVVAIITRGAESSELVYALMPGILLLITAFLTREKIGYGDGMLLLGLGLLEGVIGCLGDLLIGLLLASVFGLILFVFGKRGREITLPFVPFLLAAHALRFLVGN